MLRTQIDGADFDDAIKIFCTMSYIGLTSKMRWTMHTHKVEI